MAPADRLAAAWSATLGRLVGRAAHEVNNALNGAAMNLEVVRLRAVAGRDAGAVAPFASAATAAQDEVASLVAALVTLARAPSGAAADVRAVCAAAGALLGPVAARDAVALDLALGELPVPTAAPELTVRLAICAVMDATLDLAAGAARSSAGGAGDDRSGVLRCTLVAGDGPALEVAPAASLGDDLRGVLAAWDVRVQSAPGVTRLMFPAP